MTDPRPTDLLRDYAFPLKVERGTICDANGRYVAAAVAVHGREARDAMIRFLVDAANAAHGAKGETA